MSKTLRIAAGAISSGVQPEPGHPHQTPVTSSTTERAVTRYDNAGALSSPPIALRMSLQPAAISAAVQQKHTRYVSGNTTFLSRHAHGDNRRGDNAIAGTARSEGADPAF